MATALWQALPTAVAVPALAIAGLAAYGLLLAIYRLTLHPLAQFPGPKLTAATHWYEFYEDVIKDGHMALQVAEWHKQYGPIVRISPHEVSVNDPDFFRILYSNSMKLDKYGWFYAFSIGNISGFTTIDHNLHRMRRKPVAPYFSRKAIEKLEFLIQEKVDKLCARIAECNAAGKPIELGLGYNAMAADVVSEYCFPACYNLLDEPDFNRTYHGVIRGLHKMTMLTRFYPFILRVFVSIPPWLMQKLNPKSAVLAKHRIMVKKQVEDVINSEGVFEEKRTDRPIPTVIHEIYNDPDLPPEEKSVLRLTDDARTIIGAGSETTGIVLQTTTYELLKRPDCVRRLKEELTEAMPDLNKPTKLSMLEKLPYLTAVINEGLRFANASAFRHPRHAPKGLRYNQWLIPMGTPVSSNPVFLHDNAEIFPEPRKFIPERWLVEPEERRKLEKNLVPFSMGPRMCIGVNLANAELYLAIANVFRRFDLEIYKSTDDDFTLRHSYLSGYPKADSIGLWVRAK